MGIVIKNLGNYKLSQIEKWMTTALDEAKLAASKGEVPIGAIVVVGNEIISSAHNEVEQQKDATAHAEVLAIQRASKIAGDWRLKDASLFVTLEPCTMCIGALVLARVKNLYFGAFDERQGAVGSLYDLSQDPQLPHSIRVFSGVLADDCTKLLREFFEKKRVKTN